MKKVIVALIIIFILSIFNISYAVENVSLVTDRNIVSKGEEFNISINISNISVSALTAKISFNATKVEYLGGLENSNIVGNKVLFVWFDENGGNTPKSNETIATFKFRAKENGNAEFKIEGIFFDVNEREIPVTFSDTKILISDEIVNNENVSSDNAYLKILRLNEEGVSPNFDKNINEYIIILNTGINSLNITAIPENRDAKVDIIGNENLKNGLNIISINVTSKDNSRKMTYTIKATKTKDIQMANPNLESIEIEHAELVPAFDNNITNYSAYIPNEITIPKILAIPENSRATIRITGAENLKIGNNRINVTVTGEDGITIKTYTVNVNRMTKGEEVARAKEQEENLKKSQEIMRSASYIPEYTSVNVEKPMIDSIEGIENTKKNIIITVLIGIAVITCVSYMLYIQIKKMNKL